METCHELWVRGLQQEVNVKCFVTPHSRLLAYKKGPECYTYKSHSYLILHCGIIKLNCCTLLQLDVRGLITLYFVSLDTEQEEDVLPLFAVSIKHALSSLALDN